MNHRVDIREDIKRYQDTLSYVSSKVDYSVGQNIYMLPSNMNLKIKTGTVGYNNKILVSNGKFSLGKNVEVNTPAMISTQTAANTNDVLTHAPTITHNQEPLWSRAPPGPKTITHNDEKITLVLALASGFAIWNMF